MQFTGFICNSVFFLSQIGADDDVVTMLKKHVVGEYQRQKVSSSLSLEVVFLFGFLLEVCL